VLTVTVTPIPQAELAKTVLKINQANEATQVLNLATFTGDATGQIGVWPFITAPNPVWLRLLGKTDKGDDHSLTVYNGAGSAAVNPTWIANEKIEPGIARSYLNGLGDGTKLQVELKAAFSLSKAEADAIRFPVVEYIVATKFYDLTTFEHGDANGWDLHLQSNGKLYFVDINGNCFAGFPSVKTTSGYWQVLMKGYWNLQKGKSYKLSFDVRPVNPIITARFAVHVNAKISNFRGSFTGASWSNFSGNIRIEEAGGSLIQFWFDLPAGSYTDILVDNIILQEM
ncbi:hypothetical protein, partial [Pseudomonas lactis]